MKPFALRLFLCISALVAGVSSGRAQPPEYVSRVEYDQLKRDFDQLKLRLDTLTSDPAITPQAIPTTPNQTPPIGLIETPSPRSFLSDFKPGWERFRSSEWGWMDHNRLDEMNARIATGEGFALFAGMTSAGRFQALQQKNVVTSGNSPSRLEPGFQTAWGSFEFLADFEQELEVYFDVYLSTKAHPSQAQGHEGYMLMRGLKGPLGEIQGLKQLLQVANIKAGQFDVDFGDHRYRRTDNARGQRNPFIGNTLLDPSATEVGVEIFSKPTAINWLIGVGSGSEQGSFEKGRGLGAHAKTWINFDSLRLSGSVYYLDHDRESTSFSNLYRSSRSGGQYNGVFDNGNAPGGIFVGVGKTLSAYQADATWYKTNYEIYSHVGVVTEQAPAGDERWLYSTLDGVLRLTPRLYLDARYNVAFADQLRGNASDGRVQRIQLGGGYWLFQPVLFKLEYVHQKLIGFAEHDGLVSGVQAWRGPSFQGVIAEFTFSY